MKYWKRILTMSVGLTLTFAHTTNAAIVVPPVPMENRETAGYIVGQGSAPPTFPQDSLSGAEITTPVTEPMIPTPTVTLPAATASEGEVSSVQQSVIEQLAVEAEGAVLIDGTTGEVLYGKNQNQQFYPASITKVMTALVVLERCDLNEIVTFSSGATTNLESGAVSLNIAAGDRLTVEQSLYGLLLKSANEIGNGLAEHVSGSVSGFAELMNAKAVELGCRNTHFVNPHGLNHSGHKTTPYDMALIMRAAIQNEAFRKIDTTVSYHFPATKKAAARTITMGHKMMHPSDSRYYEGILGGKTGYTSLAGNTLVTAVEKNGVTLIAVVMKSKGSHYRDTKAMLDYGFANHSLSPSPNHVAAIQNTPLGPGTKAGWVQSYPGWYYIKADGSRAVLQWQTVDGADYWFDGDGYMATGWRKLADVWYYFKPASGAMARNNWVQDGGKWYYLGADGVMMTNGTTPDGYQVDENGAWNGL